LDSGASEHLTKNENNLRNVKLLSANPIKICIAKADITLTASKVGTIFCTAIVNGKEIQVTINDVLYIPGLEFNLLSVPKLEASDLAIIFAHGRGRMLKNTRVLAETQRRHRVYELVVYDQTEIANVVHVKEENLA